MTQSKLSSETKRLKQLEQLLDKDDEAQLPFATAMAIFDIQHSEMEIYLTTLEYPESTPAELANVLDYSRRLIRMRLSDLCEKGLVTRRERIDDKSGTRYEYTAQPLDETVDWMAEQVDEWSAELNNQLTTLREEWPENSQQETESV